MSGRPHLAHWPPGLPHSLAVPDTCLYENLAASAKRYPDKVAIHYYGTPLSYAALHRQVLALAGHLTQVLGVAPGDRVLLYMQNAPQFVTAYYAILRADAIVVPVNPMSRHEELTHILADAEPKAAVVGQELFGELEPLLPGGLAGVVVAAYAEALDRPSPWPLPKVLDEPARKPRHPLATSWPAALAAGLPPAPHRAAADDPALLVYTSGTTGRPKGALHNHRSVNATTIASATWSGLTPASVALAAMPLFHVTGMQTTMNGPIYAGGTMVMMARWERRVAARLIAHHRVSHWRSITAMAVDLLADPEIAAAELSSLRYIGGGGAQMPKTLVEKLRRLTGLDYVEGYGLSETMAATHLNPPQRAKAQCLGIPIFGVDSRIVDPDNLNELPQGAVGEIVTAAPQVFLGYWRDEAATAAAVFERDGKRFLRTGDLGYIDEEGYFFLVDRLKRMINAAGYKVWPAEVEALLYAHPAVQEACIVAAPDERRGETVKALVVLRQGAALEADELQHWCRARMAAYKVPRLVAFVADLPKSGSGKVAWRELQETEWR